MSAVGDKTGLNLVKYYKKRVIFSPLTETVGALFSVGQLRLHNEVSFLASFPKDSERKPNTHSEFISKMQFLSENTTEFAVQSNRDTLNCCCMFVKQQPMLRSCF